MSDKLIGAESTSTPPRLLERLRNRVRVKHYSLRTEKAYVGWVRRFILFHGKRHPGELGKPEVEAFLSHLATERNVSASTQTQALSALLFLYKEVLELELPWLDDVVRAKTPARLPTVLTQDDTARLLQQVSDPEMKLIVGLLYGSGMRLLEVLRLRVKDVDLSRREIVVRDGKGGKDRVTVIPTRLVEPLRAKLTWRKALHEADLAAGRGEVVCQTRWRQSTPTQRSAKGRHCEAGFATPAAALLLRAFSIELALTNLNQAAQRTGSCLKYCRIRSVCFCTLHKCLAAALSSCSLVRAGASLVTACFKSALATSSGLSSGL